MIERDEGLYELLPAVIRARDAEAGGPLQALIEIMEEQRDVVAADMDQMYDDWFIETCRDWLVPYIGELVGYSPVAAAGRPGDPALPASLARNRILMPRREVANTLRYRRRKGALALLEELARDVSGWPARAVEFYRLLGWSQNINHPWPQRGRTANLRDGDALERLGGPFDTHARTVDVRRIASDRTPGRYNIPSVGLFVWRLQVFPVSDCQAEPLPGRPHLFTFSALGNSAPLYTKPEREADATSIAGEINTPGPIRRRAFAEGNRASPRYYGPGKSVHVCVYGWEGRLQGGPVPASQVIPADLTGWGYEPPRGTIAVDPVLGRLAFHRDEVSWPGVRTYVDYHYAFPAAIGGGEYEREIESPEGALLLRVTSEEGEGFYSTLAEAITAWNEAGALHGVIELSETNVYVEQLEPVLLPYKGQRLTIRAAQSRRPILRIDQPLTVALVEGCIFTLDGVLVEGNAVNVKSYRALEEQDPRRRRRKRRAAAKEGAGQAPTVPECLPDQGEVIVRHSTLVPGWTLDVECEPERPVEPSLVIDDVNVRVRVEHSITGSIIVDANQVELQPLPLLIADSIVDATSLECGQPQCVAISDGEFGYAHVMATVLRSTIIGRVLVHAVELGENSIFLSTVRVVRSQVGCMRFSYVSPGSRTPRRANCQPDLALEALAQRPGWAALPAAKQEQAKTAEARRVRPVIDSLRYGLPDYCQLSLACPQEIARGADDESEMGVYHDLYQPQRIANLTTRLAEYSPAGTDAGLIFAS